MSKRYRDAVRLGLEKLEVEAAPREQFGRQIQPNIKTKIPERVRKGERMVVSAEFTGTCTNGFLDIYLVAPNGNAYWFPDPKSWDSARDTGMISLKSGNYSSNWEVMVYPKFESGTYVAGLGMWEDPEGLPNKGRRVIVEAKSKVEVF